ncbi:MAG TPA: IclR family transcriptional regulator [Firmicutes bacterium]|nr:IclR family transcriptional regulator [Bacillota bacterium]
MQIINRLIEILFALADARTGLGITELAETVRLPKSTVHRILQSLLKYRFVCQDEETKKYRLGLGILALGTSLLNQIDIRSVILPYLESLSERLGETVFLTVLEGDQAICVEKVESQEKRVRFFAQIGSVMPFHCTASGKAILAFQPKAVVERILSGYNFERYTASTITSREELEKELAGVREKGYAVCDREMEGLVRAVAAPIRRDSGRVTASITVIGLIDRFDRHFMARAARLTMECADQISRQLGYRDPSGGVGPVSCPTERRLGLEERPVEEAAGVCE